MSEADQYPHTPPLMTGTPEPEPQAPPPDDGPGGGEDYDALEDTGESPQFAQEGEYERKSLIVRACQVVGRRARVRDQSGAGPNVVIGQPGDWLVAFPDGRLLKVNDDAFRADFAPIGPERISLQEELARRNRLIGELQGEVDSWRTRTGDLERTLSGHREEIKGLLETNRSLRDENTALHELLDAEAAKGEEGRPKGEAAGGQPPLAEGQGLASGGGEPYVPTGPHPDA